MNGDGINGNDLIFVPNNASELTFVDFTSNGVTFTATQQAAAFDKYIDQDAYLSTRRGQYAERNGALLPWLWRADFSFLQEFYVNTGGKRNTCSSVQIFSILPTCLTRAGVYQIK